MAQPHDFDRRLPLLLAALGLSASIVLEVVHVRAYLDPSIASFCNVGDRFDCDAVALSRASVILGVPTALWGIAGYLGLLIAATRRSPLLLPLAATAAIATTALAIVGWTSVGALCLICELVHLVSLALVIVAWRARHLATWRSPKRRHAPELAWPLLLVVLARVFAPPYWVLVSWKSGPRLEHGVTAEGQRWIGADEPRLVVHEYVDYACPHCAVASSRMRMQVARHASELQLVRHHYPRMRCVPASPDRCTSARTAVCAGEQDRFWEMEDWLFHHAPGQARIELGPAIDELGLDGAALETCMNDPALFERLDDEVQAAHRAKIREVPAYVVEGETMREAEVRALIDDRL
ncbi:vitamin K epoxide reductase family protein [Nannocystaceae bacterium ST9]